MVSGLRGGHSLVSVLGLVAREVPEPIGPEFRIGFDEQNYGLELRTALENLSVRVPIQDLRIVITAILIQKETGGNLAEVLDKCALCRSANDSGSSGRSGLKPRKAASQDGSFHCCRSAWGSRFICSGRK